MKKTRIITAFISLTLVLAVILSGCSKTPATLEEFISNNDEASSSINEIAESSGLSIKIAGNDITYTYDIKNMDGVTEEIGTSDEMVKSLTSALDGVSDTFISLCKQLEEQSKIDGIRIIVNYTYGDKVLVSKTFNSSGAE